MLPNLTAIIACKDRLRNLRFCLASLNNCKPKPKVIVVDFGSKKEIKANVPAYDWLKVIRVKRKTKLFHKARALNIGIKSVKTKFLCITDADQIFQANFFGEIATRLNKNEKLYIMCKTYFLKSIPKHINEKNIGLQYSKVLQLAKRDTPKIRGEGCCQATTTAWFTRMGGYEEKYIGFSGEDSDVNIRAIKSGLTRIFINKHTTLIHLPHMKEGEYYSGKYRVANRNLYKKRAKAPLVKANVGRSWGQM